MAVQERSRIWRWVLGQTSVRRQEADLVDATIAEAKRRITAMEPAPQSEMSFEGGRRRAIRMLDDMRNETRW
jgi:hypothetical protein